jgi:hypothetical protein
MADKRPNEESTTKIARRRLDIRVEQKHIDQAMPHDSGHCMIADAVSEHKFAKNVSVDLATIRFTDRKSGLRYAYLTPPVAQMALLNFDQGIETKPFKFQLRTAIQIAPKQTKKPGRKHSKSTVAYQPQEVALAQSTNADKTGMVPVKIGGNLPPLGPLSSSVRTGRVRRFGLRLLKP